MIRNVGGDTLLASILWILEIRRRRGRMFHCCIGFVFRPRSV